MRRHAWNCDLSSKPGTDILTNRHIHVYIYIYMYTYIYTYVYTYMYINMVVYGNMILWSESYAYATQANLQYHTQPVDPMGRRTWLLPLVFPHAQVVAENHQHLLWQKFLCLVVGFSEYLFKVLVLPSFWLLFEEHEKSHSNLLVAATSPFSWQLHPS